MAGSGYLQAHNTVNQIITALENMTDPLEIDGLVLRLDYLIRTLVNFENDPQTDEIIHLLGEAYDELTYAASKAQSRSADAEFVDFASQVHIQRRGRPALDIKVEQLSFLLDEGFNIPTIALLFRVSSCTIERRMKKYGLSVSG